MGEAILADNQLVDVTRSTTEDPGSCPFEGPEKLLEIWFAPSPGDDAPHDGTERVGLRKVDRGVWEDMLDIVQCKVLSVMIGRDMDAYLLSYEKVWRCFYSRKSFMFPDRQVGPHREWRDEVEYLDALFDNGAAYTVGKMNGDHWLLYMTSPLETATEALFTSVEDETTPTPHHMTSSVASSATLSPAFAGQDYTLEILMAKLGTAGRRPFLFIDGDLQGVADDVVAAAGDGGDSDAKPESKGVLVSRQLGIDAIFPASRTRLDSFAFEPCGYSANALVDSGSGDEGYYTIHVTPEEGWSYASFECNVPVYPTQDEGVGSDKNKNLERMPDLETLIQRVVNIFQPGHLTLTLFVSSDIQNPTNSMHFDVLKEEEQPASVEVAQHAFRRALIPRGYCRTDKINYEFSNYDLAFATFQKKPSNG